jgi:hypothetical protein
MLPALGMSQVELVEGMLGGPGEQSDLVFAGWKIAIGAPIHREKRAGRCKYLWSLIFRVDDSAQVPSFPLAAVVVFDTRGRSGRRIAHPVYKWPSLTWRLVHCRSHETQADPCCCWWVARACSLISTL